MSLALIQPGLGLILLRPSPDLKFCEVLDWAFLAISPQHLPSEYPQLNEATQWGTMVLTDFLHLQLCGP